MKKKPPSLLKFTTIESILKDSILMLKPQEQYKNPVMFVTYIGAIITTLCLFEDIAHLKISWFNFHITLWLWFTVIFANFASVVAESKGKAQAESLRKTKIEAYARQIRCGIEVKIPSSELRRDDTIICAAGDIIPVDGDVIEGVATVDESAITGESAPVIRESGGDRCAVTAGTKVLSDRITIKVVSEPGKSFLDRIINLVEGAKRQKTPNEIALHILLSALTIIFLFTTSSLKMFADYSESVVDENRPAFITIPILISLLVCLIPTTISALVNAIGIAGMDRLIAKNVIAKSGRSVEAAGDIDVLILDKTGTITIGNRMATAFLPAVGQEEKELARVSQLASLCDETPEGRSIVVLAKTRYGLRADSLEHGAAFIPFSAKTRMSGIDYTDSNNNVTKTIRKGASDAIRQHIESLGGVYPEELTEAVRNISKMGGTPLLVSDDKTILGVIYLKDIIKGGIKERFAEMRRMGIRTLMVTGDNPLTAAAIAAEAGVA